MGKMVNFMFVYFTTHKKNHTEVIYSPDVRDKV